MKSSIYYFSGTGNSFYIAKRIAKEIENTQIYSIAQLRDCNIEDDSDYIGFIFPVYFQDTPQIVKSVMKKIKTKKDAYIYLIANANGLPSKTFANADKIFKKKKKLLDALFYFDMPGNSIVFFDFSNKQEIRDYRLALSEQHLEHIIPMIKKKFKYRELAYGTSSYLKSFFDKIMLTFFVKDRTFYTNSKCTHCGICIKICPLKNISIQNRKVKWNGDCVNCWGCLNRCPNNAIENFRTEGLPRYKHPDIDSKEYY